MTIGTTAADVGLLLGSTTEMLTRDISLLLGLCLHFFLLIILWSR